MENSNPNRSFKNKGHGRRLHPIRGRGQPKKIELISSPVILRGRATFHKVVEGVNKIETVTGQVVCFCFDGDRCLIVREKTLSNLEKNLKVSLSL